ncbi:MAG: hypothetical protein V3V97_01350 [Hyphomicrobiaceae bacterium]
MSAPYLTPSENAAFAIADELKKRLKAQIAQAVDEASATDASLHNLAVLTADALGEVLAGLAADVGEQSPNPKAEQRAREDILAAFATAHSSTVEAIHIERHGRPSPRSPAKVIAD